MLIAPQLSNESQRVAALRRLRVLDTAPERSFDDVVALAAQMCVMPIALVTLVDSDRQWFKAKLGLDLSQTGRRESFCGHAIGYPDQVLVIEDTWRDARFADNPLVRGEPGIRFYAGAPVLSSQGLALGTVCVIDREPRRLERWQLSALSALARQVGRMLEHSGLPAEDRPAAWQGAARAHLDIDRLFAIASASEQLTAFVDPNYILRFVNDRFAEHWDRPRDQLLGRPVAKAVGDEVFDRQLRPLIDRALAGEVIDIEVGLRLPTRGQRQMLLHLEPAHGANGAINGVVMGSRDVQPFLDRLTQMRATVDRLEKRTLMQDRMLHILAHDLREPLNTVLNFSGLLQGAAEGLDPKERSYLAYTRRGAERMQVLIDDLMHYVGTGQDGIAAQRVDLGAMVSALALEMADTLHPLSARIEAGELPVIEGDPVLVRLMLQNLVLNALRFARPGVAPVVRVEAQAADDAWDLTVTDNGIGIPAVAQEEVFDLFRRLSPDRSLPGTGLGLALCRRVVEQHGGVIRVEAGPGGAGSRFHIRWPRAAPLAASAAG